MPLLELHDVDCVRTMENGASTAALHRVSLGLEAGEYLTVVGPSGSGKTTLLRVIAGLEPTASGRIILKGRDATGLKPGLRPVSMVFQELALHPHLTVREQWELVGRLRSVPRDEVHRRLGDLSASLELGDLVSRLPGDLSGGERQRAALGRALMSRPEILLLDEPLASLDAILRTRFARILRGLPARYGITVVHVTHDPDEAMGLGHRVAILLRGQIRQAGTPCDVYNAPVDLEVARTLGDPPINVARGGLMAEGGTFRFLPEGLGGGTDIGVPASSCVGAGEPRAAGVQLAVRPEDVRVVMDGAEGWMCERVSDVFHGYEWRTEVRFGSCHWCLRRPRDEGPLPAGPVRVMPVPGKVHFFDSEGRMLGGRDR